MYLFVCVYIFWLDLSIKIKFADFLGELQPRKIASENFWPLYIHRSSFISINGCYFIVNEASNGTRVHWNWFERSVERGWKHVPKHCWNWFNYVHFRWFPCFAWMSFWQWKVGFLKVLYFQSIFFTLIFPWSLFWS